MPELDLERDNMLAVVRIQADGGREVAYVHAQGTAAEGQIQASLVEGEAGIEVNQVATVSTAEAQSTYLQAQASGGLVATESYLSSYVRGYEARNDAALTRGVAANDVALTQQVTAAAVRASTSEATIRTTAQKSVANLQASTARTEADVRVTSILAQASASNSAEVAVANVRAGATAAVAGLRVTQIRREQAATTDEIAGIARIEAATTASEAAIRSAGSKQSAAWQTREIAGAAAERNRGVAGEATVQVTEAGSSATVRFTTDAALTATENAQEASLAAADSAATRHRSDADHTASLSVTDNRYAEEVFSADRQAEVEKYRADQGFVTDTVTADYGLRTKTYESAKDYAGRVNQAAARSADEKYASDSRYAGVVLSEDGETERLLKSLAFAESHFEIVWALLGGKFPDPSSALLTPGFRTVLPEIPTSGAASPSVQRVQANRLRAASGVAAHAKYLSARDDASARGLGGHAPFVQMARYAATVTANAEALTKEGELLAGFAQADAAHRLKGQSLRSDVWAAQNQAYLEAEANDVRRQVGVVGGILRVISGGV